MNTLPKRPPSRPMLDKRTGLINTGWKALAPSDVFGALTQTQYGDKRQLVFDLRIQLAGSEQETKRLRDMVQAAELDLWGASGLVTRGVAGDPAFGPNSPLYGSFGLVRASERKSGLTRKLDASLKRAKAAKVEAVALPRLPALASLELDGALNGNGKH